MVFILKSFGMLLLSCLIDSNKEVVIMAGGNMSASYGGNFSGSVEPFSLISSTNFIRIELPLLRGIGSHSFTFNITSTDQPGLLLYWLES